MSYYMSDTYDGDLSADSLKEAVYNDIYNTHETPYLNRETGVPPEESAAEGSKLNIITHIFDTANDGRNFVHDNFKAHTWACENYAFRTYELIEESPTKTMMELKNRIQREKQKSVKYFADHHVKHRKSTYVGCKRCGSSVHKDYVQSSNCCPVCGNSLFSKTDTETMKRYRENIARWEANYQKMAKARAKKKLVWYVNTCYH